MTSNVLYDLGEFFEAVAVQDVKLNLAQFFSSLDIADTAADAKIKILAQFNEAMDLVGLLPISEERIVERMTKLREIQHRFLTNFNLGTVGEFANKVQAKNNASLLSAYGDAVQDLDSSQPLNRQTFLSDTQTLIEEIESAKMEEFLREPLLLKLKSITRLVQECHQLSDDDLRARVKSIYADCAKDFLQFDRKHEKVMEMVGRWATKASKAGIFALALTADVSQVTALIEHHGEPKAISGPEE